jgi:hypothetical protein
MLDLIRVSALPAQQMISAARGALRVPTEEMLEILVYLSENNKIYGEQARLTLAGWEEGSAKAIAARPEAPRAVLDYWLAAKNRRAGIFPSLLENPSVSLAKLAELLPSLKGEWIDLMLESPRVLGSRQLLEELRTSRELSGAQAARIQQLLGGPPAAAATEAQNRPTEANEAPGPRSLEQAEGALSSESLPPPAEGGRAQAVDAESEQACLAFMAEHSGEIAAEPDKPFQPMGGMQEEAALEIHAAAAAAPAGPAALPTASGLPARKKLINPQDEQRGSVLQKIAELDVKGRIQLAIRGNKEERSILVRDGTKVVAIAVLNNPKLADSEVEKFATQKNVLEAVLRTIPLKRRFAKNYAIIRNLAFNPRTPLDVSLALLKNLLVQDLRNLSGNKEVADTVRKLALRLFKQKIEVKTRD